MKHGGWKVSRYVFLGQRNKSHKRLESIPLREIRCNILDLYILNLHAFQACLAGIVSIILRFLMRQGDPFVLAAMLGFHLLLKSRNERFLCSAFQVGVCNLLDQFET